jgi:acyl-CoA synthetase (AMP-forming)/AMP-acid ligase II
MNEKETLLSRLQVAGELDAGMHLVRTVEREDVYSYGQLLHRADQLAISLRHHGVVAGDEVILQLDSVDDYLTAFWACLVGRFLAVPLACGSKQEQLNRVYQVHRRLRQCWFVTTQPQLSRLEAFWYQCSEDVHRLRASAILIDGITSDSSAMLSSHEPPQPQDVAFIQFSSGSTGNPKGVVLTHAEILANCRAFIDRAAVSRSDIPLSWMPLTHDMGLIGTHLGSIVAGVSPILMPTSLFVRRPLLWLEKAHQHRATILSSPNFGLQYTLAAFRSVGRDLDWDLTAVRLIWNGAEPISYRTCEDFQRMFAAFGLPANAIYPCYGLAEATVAATLQDPGEPVRTHRLRRDFLAVGDQVAPAPDDDPGVTFCECGYPLPCCDVKIADVSGEVLPTQHIGHVLIKGSSVMRRYHADAAATTQAKRADGWLDTGDLGFLTASGRLVITGRWKDIIVLNGVNLYPQDIEGLIERVEGVTAGQVAVCGVKRRNLGLTQTALAAFIVYRQDSTQFGDIARLARREILKATGIRLDYIVQVMRLPRTTSGKIRRFELAIAFDSGQLDTLPMEQGTGPVQRTKPESQPLPDGCALEAIRVRPHHRFDLLETGQRS